MDNPEGRVEAGIRLNQAANELLAAYITHMNREETELIPWMKEHYSNAEIVAMRTATRAQLPPDRAFAILRWMLPSLNVIELSGFILDVKAQASAQPQAFKAIIDLCEARVGPSRWREVKRVVGL